MLRRSKLLIRVSTVAQRIGDFWALQRESFFFFSPPVELELEYWKFVCDAFWSHWTKPPNRLPVWQRGELSGKLLKTLSTFRHHNRNLSLSCPLSIWLTHTTRKTPPSPHHSSILLLGLIFKPALHSFHTRHSFTPPPPTHTCWSPQAWVAISNY